MQDKITIVIPCREPIDCRITLDTLALQTDQNFKIVIVPDRGRGAAWARNQGFKMCDTEFVLFSDDDVAWRPEALENLLATLKRFPRASYAYGRFKVGDAVWGHQMFDPAMLWGTNYITTMSLIRAKDFPGFDESLQRFQDWDLWLTMLKQGKRGVYSNALIFTTEVRMAGISHGTLSNDEAAKVVNDKHGLNMWRFRIGML